MDFLCADSERERGAYYCDMWSIHFLVPRLAGKMKRIGLHDKLGLPDQSIHESGCIAFTYQNDKLTALDAQVHLYGELGY